MSREVGLFEHADQLAVIVDDYILKGQSNPTKIAKETGLPRYEVVQLINEWNAIAANTEWVKERAQQSLKEFDDSYGQVIAQLWETYEEAEAPRDRNAILKNIADVQAKRQDTLQRAGLYDDAALGDQIVALEEQTDRIKALLKKVAKDYPETRTFIMEELGRIFREPVAVDA